MNKKQIITRYNDRIFTMLQSNSRVVTLSCYEQENSLIQNIYIVKVKDVVKYLNAAFIEYQPGEKGYYPLNEGIKPVFIKHSNSTDNICQGDELLLQVKKDGTRTKEAVFTSNINLSGKNVVLTIGKCFVGFSNKIKSEQWKVQVRKRITRKCTDEYGFIIRTNAEQLMPETLELEIDQMIEKWTALKNQALHRTCYSLIYQEMDGYLQEIKNSYSREVDEIITDIPEYHAAILKYLEAENPAELPKLKYYQDDLLPLYKLYQLEKALKDATNKKVWLKSGGYLLIEPTEALTVIDVNSGKMQTKKQKDAAFLKVNLEAAMEIAKQLRLRNISGIIIVDFINLKNEESKNELLDAFTKMLQRDSIKTTLIEMTKLGLVEITRRKVRGSLQEQLNPR